MRRISFYTAGISFLSFFKMASGQPEGQDNNNLENENRGTKDPKKLNVLFIAVDDLRPELGCYGHSMVKSPNIDKLASEGVMFNNAFCQVALSNPTRASLLTGMRPDAIKVYDLQAHFRDYAPESVTLPEYFKQQGYHSVSLGKIFHLKDEQSWSIPSWDSDKPNYVLEENLELIRTSERKRGPSTEIANVSDTAYCDGAIAERAVKALRSIGDKPFFLAVGFYKPHLPFCAPEKYWNMYNPDEITVPDTLPPLNVASNALTNFQELRNYSGVPAYNALSEQQSRHLIHGYYASVSYMDAQVGKILDELKRLGLDENTIVILWGDHGWKLGEYGNWCKHTNVDYDLRVPLIIKTPAMKSKGKQVNAIAELIDVYPTLCNQAGLQIPGKLQGEDFSFLLNSADDHFKDAAFSQFERPNNIMGYSIRTSQYRYTCWLNTNNKEVYEEELYDYHNDPQGMMNVVNNVDYDMVIKKLKEMLNFKL